MVSMDDETIQHYIADLVIEFRIEDEPNRLIHRNATLVFARNPDEAYEEALKLGASQEVSYVNTDGMGVQCVFRGIAELSHIHEALEHGGELSYREIPDATEAAILKMIGKKEEFSAMPELKVWNADGSPTAEMDE